MLTKRGWSILAFMAIIYVVADASSVQILYLLFTALLLVVIFSLIMLRRAPRGMSLSRTLGTNPCNERSLVRVDVTLRTKRGVSGLVLALEDQLPDELEIEGEPSSIGSGQSYSRQTYYIRANKRGLFEVGPARVRVVDIFGIGVSTFRIGEENRLVVYPEHGPVEVFRGRESTEVMGVSTTEQKGASSDFLRIRPYEPGDEVRTIHWRSSAKIGRLMVRELEKEEVRSTIVLLNCEENSNRGREDVFETGVRVAASIAVSSLKEDMEVKMILYGGSKEILGSGRGRVQYHRILSSLSAVESRGDTPLSFIIDRISKEEGGTGTIHIISPMIQDRDVKSISYLIRRGISPAVILTDESPPPLGLRNIRTKIGHARTMEGRTVISWMN
jgi:uncharacterized protein (DUF58 family)